MDGLTINGTNAYSAWGITLDDTAVAALMTPPPIKTYITCKSRNEDGERVVKDDKIFFDSRDITLQLNITAPNRSVFLSRYASFCAMLKEGFLDIATNYTSGVFHCMYVSCSQFSQYDGQIGKFVLKLTEYNPNIRV